MDRFGELLGGAGELAQNQDPVFIEPRRDELFGDQVRPVTERCHEHHIGGAVHRDELVYLHRYGWRSNYLGGQAGNWTCRETASERL
jgi:hypothetical protein